MKDLERSQIRLDRALGGNVSTLLALHRFAGQSTGVTGYGKRVMLLEVEVWPRLLGDDAEVDSCSTRADIIRHQPANQKTERGLPEGS